MLCRAVLAAAALSCTLLALANTQGTELVQLKDLVCVLWLSGLQKEDLDVNLLKKLHRHNVNIDDIMNNETMQHECEVKKPESTSRTKMPVLKMKITATLSTTLDPAKSVNATRDKYIDTIVKFISNAQSTNSNFTEERKLDKTRRSPKNKNLETNLLRPKNDKTNIPFESDSGREVQSTSRREVQSASKRQVEIESKEDDLKLQQNILNFWEKMSKTEMPQNVDDVLSTLPVVSSKNIFRQRLLSRRVPKVMTLRPYFTTSTPLQSNDIETLIARFISKNMGQKSSTTTTTTQSSNIPDDLGEVFLPFYRDLIRRFNSKQPVRKDVKSQVQANETPSRNYINYKETTEEPQKFGRINVPNTVLSSFDNILQNNGRINNPFKRNMFPKVPYIGDLLLKQQEIVGNMETLYDNSNNRRSLTKGTVVANDQSQNIPNNTLQQIAESVKAIVLKDIAHLIMSTTPSSTQLELSALPLLTTMRTLQDTVTSPKPQDKTDANHVMEKILEIYQRIKAISDNTELSLDAKYKQLSVNQEHSGASNLNLPPHITNTNVIHRTSNVHNVLINPTSFRDLTQQEIRKMPSIIQTNSGEIAPLVLPMSNPLKIINQIVVVTTETAVKKSDINEKVRSRFEAFMDDLNKNKIHAVAHQKNDHKYVPKHERYSHFGYSDLNHSHKDQLDIPSKHDFLSGEQLYDQSHRYREFRGGANDKNRNHNGVEREHINYSEHILGLGHSDLEKMPRHRHAEKFHEQLEKGDERWGDNMQDYMRNERDRGHSRHVVPRHQQPLSDRKPPYDDTHFRNFLKTQEKVNDMLEKILGRKAKFEEYSVETT